VSLTLAACWLLLGIHQSRASTAAQIAFSAGDHIYVMHADGSGRTPLSHDPRGTISGQAAWSPDGARIAFVRDRGNRSEGVWIMNADGSGAHPITPTPARNVEESTPAWSPDGHRLVFSRIRLGPKTLTARIVVADDNGHNARILVGETARRIVSLDSPVWAPDGARVLFTRTTLDKHAFFRPTLQVVNADGTGRRTLAPNASGGSWSPDGERIAFVSVRDRNGDECGSDECSYDGEIYVMNTNGSTLHRLTVSKADDEAPAWSGDGQRIAFQSDRNFPDGQSPEVYSVKPDGTCLTWLTNGTPGSGYPAWRPGSGSSGPGACGATQRPPLVETDVKRATRFHRYPLYWLGRVSARGLLVGDVSREFGFFFVDYDDCGRYYPSECPGLVGLEERRTCRSHPFLDLSRRPRMFRRRGALVYVPGGPDEAAEIYTGGVEIRVFTDRRRDLGDVVSELIPVHGHLRADGTLPRARLPNRLWRSLHRTSAAVRRLGSVRAAAHALGISRGAVRRRVALLRRLRSVGHVGVLHCHAKRG